MKTYYITYPHGKYKAITLSYDDGKVQDRRLIDILNRYGLKGTFHLNGGLFPTEDEVETPDSRIKKSEVASLYQGHEVACHTYTHPTIARCPIDKVADEVIMDRQVLEELVDYPVCGFSYPNGSYNQAIQQLLPLLGIEYARPVGSTKNFSIPENWYEWQPTCHHNNGLIALAEAFTQLHKSQYLYLMYVWGHCYEFDHDENWELMEEFAAHVSKDESIWFVTNIEYKRYMEASKRLVFTNKGDKVYNPNAQTVWIRINQYVFAVKPGMNDLSKNQ